jgi:hypothetical protein
MAYVSPEDGFTHHAASRVQQRCVPPIIIDYLLDFGVRSPAGPGAESYRFCKRGWRRLMRHLGPAAKHFNKYRNLYVVIGDGRIITVAYMH